jgi:hypothetical protein
LPSPVTPLLGREQALAASPACWGASAPTGGAGPRSREPAPRVGQGGLTTGTGADGATTLKARSTGSPSLTRRPASACCACASAAV